MIDGLSLSSKQNSMTTEPPPDILNYRDCFIETEFTTIHLLTEFSNMESILAIDFGSSNSVAYLFKNGKSDIVNDDCSSGVTRFPSLVMYTNNGVLTCTEAEKRRGNRGQEYCVSCVKRIIGLTYQEYLELPDRDIFGCSVVDGNDNYPRFVVSEKREKKDCIEVAAEIFKNIRKEAERMNENTIRSCYVTVPANYQETQRRAIMKAAEKAGMKVEKLFIEPTAAAMSWCYNFKDQVDTNDTILVFDFGGGTLDLSVLRYENGHFKVITTDGDPRLGGNDVDREVANVVCERLNRDFGSFEPRHQLRLLRQCEQAKILLGTQTDYEISMEMVDPKFDQDICLNQSSLQAIVDDIFMPRIRACLDRVMTNVDCAIDHVLLVGGSSRLLSIRDHLKQRFPNAHFPNINPESCVAEGAMIMACGAIKPVECLNFSYGILTSKTNEVVMMLSKGTELPCTSKPRQFRPNKLTRDIYSSVYQWNGSYKKGESCLKPVDECIRVAAYAFRDKPRFFKKPTFSITFSAEEGGLLVVECCDQNGNVLDKSEYDALLQ